MKFSELDLDKKVLSGIKNAGFTSCMPVQEKVLPYCLDGEDVMVQSKTGSGKTAVFVIAFLQKYITNLKNKIKSKCLIVAPTRELAQQISSDAEILCKGIKDFSIGCFYGGVGYEKQQVLLKNGCDMYIGTPGRLLDFISSNSLRLDEVDTFVIDEADRMFDMGFYPDIQKIFNNLRKPEERQTMLFSATLEMRVRELAWQYMNNPVEIELEKDSITVDKITQELYHVAKADKFMLLLQLLKCEMPKTALIFTNLRQMTQELSVRLSLNGWNATYISGDLSQSARQEALEKIKNGKTTILVATDVAARGLQIDDLPLVINYDIPEDYENYVHRIGRTARAGKDGKAITLADEEFVYGLEAIEKYIKMKIPVIWPDNLPILEDKSLGKKWYVSKPENVKKKAPKKSHDNKKTVSPKKNLGSMTEQERMEYYKKKYGFEELNAIKPVKKHKKHSIVYLLWTLPILLVLFILYFVFGFVVSALLRLLFMRRLGEEYLYKASSLTSNIFLKILGANVTVKGDLSHLKDNKVCFVCNHQSITDILVLYGTLGINAGFIAKKSLSFIPVFNLIALCLNCIFLDRKNIHKGAKAIQKGINKIQNGKSMLIFPEGTRSKTSKILDFKKGSFKLATSSKATIVPIVIKGTRNLVENRKKAFIKTNVKVYVLSPVATDKLDREHKYQIIEKIEKDIVKIYEKL